MRLHYWLICCLASAGAGFAGCSYTREQDALAPQAAAETGFFLTDEGGAAKLAYGVANSDDVGLMMECAKGSKTIRVTDQVRSNSAPQLVLISDGGRSELKAATEASETGQIVTASAPMASPALVGFRKSGKLEIAYAGLRYGLQARPSERPVVDRFFAACEGRAA